MRRARRSAHRSDGNGCVYRARGRELLARTGTLARIPSHFIRVLPKIRTTASSSASRSLCRYACVYPRGSTPLAQGARAPSRHGAAGTRRELLAAAVAAAGQRVRLPGRGGLGARAHRRAVRLLRVRACGRARPGSRRPDARRGPGRGRHRRRRRAAGERRRGERARRAGSAVGPPRSDRSHHRGPRAADATRRNSAAIDAHRRAERRPLGAHPPGQTSSLVARRRPDLPVPPGWRASPSHPLVGGDRRPAPVGSGRRGRRRDHDRLVGVRGPRAERQRRGRHPVNRPDDGSTPCSTARSSPPAGRRATRACWPTTPARR